jgi:hypothetical protein
LIHSGGICSNSLHIRQDTLEQEALGGLQARVLRQDVAAYAWPNSNGSSKRKWRACAPTSGAARQEPEKLKAEISNLESVIADGRQSPALPAQLEKRERRLDEISEQLLASTGNGLEVKLQQNEEFAMKRLQDIQRLLRGDVLRAKSELAKHCSDITLTPKGNSYTASGDLNLLRGRSGGAGGPACTTRPIEFRFSLVA